MGRKSTTGGHTIYIAGEEATSQDARSTPGRGDSDAGVFPVSLLLLE